MRTCLTCGFPVAPRCTTGLCRSCYNRANHQKRRLAAMEPVPAPEGLTYGERYIVSLDAPQDRGRVGVLMQYNDMTHEHRQAYAMLRDEHAAFCVHHQYVRPFTEEDRT